MPYYWRRGLAAGIIIWIVLTFLVSRLDMRYKQMDSNVEGVQPELVYEAPKHRTDFGMFLGCTIFALFCSVPGPHRKAGEAAGQEGPKRDQN